MANEENLGQEISGEVSSAARNTVAAARSAKRIATSAASGNYVGAAVEAARNPQVVIAILLAGVLIFLLFFAAIFYAAPMAMYETIQSLAVELKNAWDTVKADFYSGDGGVVERFGNAISGILKRSWTSVSSGLRNVWNTLTSSQTDNGNGAKDKDVLADADSGVIGLQDDAIEVYSRKIEAVKDKLKVRSDYIEQSIIASCNGSISNTGTVNGWIYNYLFAPRDSNVYQTYDSNWWANEYNYDPGVAMKDNVVEVVYGGVTPTVSSQAIKTRAAVDLIGLYSALHNTSAENVKVYELMKWMGYKGWNNGSNYFVLGDVININIDAWTGTFMPKYLEDEKSTLNNHNRFMNIFGQAGNGNDAYANTDVYEDYGAATADLVITLSSSSLPGLRPLVQLEPFQHWEKIRNRYTEDTSHWDMQTNRVYYHYTDFIPSYSKNSYVEGRFGSDYVFVLDSLGRRCRKPLNDNACRSWITYMNENYGTSTSWHWVEEYTEHPAEFGYVERNRAVVSYSFSASIGIRNISAIADLAGFVDRPVDIPDAETTPETELEGDVA